MRRQLPYVPVCCSPPAPDSRRAEDAGRRRGGAVCPARRGGRSIPRARARRGRGRRRPRGAGRSAYRGGAMRVDARLRLGAIYRRIDKLLRAPANAASGAATAPMNRRTRPPKPAKRPRWWPRCRRPGVGGAAQGPQARRHHRHERSDEGGDRAVADPVPPEPDARLGKLPIPAPPDVAAIRKAGLPEALLFGMLAQESGGKVHAVSRSGASGLLQFMSRPVRVSDWAWSTASTSASTRAAARANAAYINEQLGVFNDNLELAIAAYNGGEGAMQRWRSGTTMRDSGIRKSISRFTGNARLCADGAGGGMAVLHPERYNLRFPKLDRPPRRSCWSGRRRSTS